MSADPRQLSIFGGEEFVMPEPGSTGPAIGNGDALPPGPYALGLLYDWDAAAWLPPFTIRAADGRTIAGHIDSLECAKAIRDALNATCPTEISP